MDRWVSGMRTSATSITMSACFGFPIALPDTRGSSTSSVGSILSYGHAALLKSYIYNSTAPCYTTNPKYASSSPAGPKWYISCRASARTNTLRKGEHRTSYPLSWIMFPYSIGPHVLFLATKKDGGLCASTFRTSLNASHCYRPDNGIGFLRTPVNTS